jgi:TPR repeat protein
MKRLFLVIGISALLAACGESDMVSKAKSGDAQGQFELAMAYREGKDVEKDLQASFMWLKEAAKGGHVEALDGGAEGLGRTVSGRLSRRC